MAFNYSLNTHVTSNIKLKRKCDTKDLLYHHRSLHYACLSSRRWLNLDQTSAHCIHIRWYHQGNGMLDCDVCKGYIYIYIFNYLIGSFIYIFNSLFGNIMEFRLIFICSILSLGKFNQESRTFMLL